MEPEPTAEISFQQVLEALLDVDQIFHPRFLYHFSDLEPAETKSLAGIWANIPLWRRQALLEDVEQLAQNDTLLDFVEFSLLAIKDTDAKVRLSAVRILWEYDEPRLVAPLCQLLENDADAEVRVAAADALGRYVYFGELKDIPEKTLHRVEDLLLKVIAGNDIVKVRSAALEALGYSSREEAPALIENAYNSHERAWVASALFAMGRSGDTAWTPKILPMLENQPPSIRCEAARAAGELEIAEAAPLLIELLDDPDDETRAASIWSLSQIGGEAARHALERLYNETDDDDELELLDEALENLAFTDGLSSPLQAFKFAPGKEMDDFEDFEDFDALEELEDELFEDEGDLDA